MKIRAAQEALETQFKKVRVTYLSTLPLTDFPRKQQKAEMDADFERRLQEQRTQAEVAKKRALAQLEDELRASLGAAAKDSTPLPA